MVLLIAMPSLRKQPEIFAAGTATASPAIGTI